MRVALDGKNADHFAAGANGNIHHGGSGALDIAKRLKLDGRRELWLAIDELRSFLHNKSHHWAGIRTNPWWRRFDFLAIDHVHRENPKDFVFLREIKMNITGIPAENIGGDVKNDVGGMLLRDRRA